MPVPARQAAVPAGVDGAAVPGMRLAAGAADDRPDGFGAGTAMQVGAVTAAAVSFLGTAPREAPLPATSSSTARCCRPATCGIVKRKSDSGGVGSGTLS
jgi:hypothetical protein